jgi:hypothetical protein
LFLFAAVSREIKLQQIYNRKWRYRFNAGTEKFLSLLLRRV